MPPATAAPKTKPQILFVDDEPDFLRIARETFDMLSDGRWQVHEAHSADAALEFLQRQKVDLVVVDINMPLLDGVQLLRILGRRHPDIKKVTLTGFATETKRNECLANGAELFIEKPRTSQGFKSVFVMLDELVSWTPQRGFHGMLRQVGLDDVIQMECLGRNSSILEIHNDRNQGRIYIEDGSIIHAASDNLTGEAAFNKLLCVTGGQFKLLPFEMPEVRTIDGSWEFLLMEAARVRDELAAQTAEEGQAAAVAPAPEPEPVAQPDVAVTETLVCNASGEALYSHQCPDAIARVALLQTISQQAGLITAGLPLGRFDRLEIEQGAQRITALVAPTHLTFVRVVNLAAPA